MEIPATLPSVLVLDKITEEDCNESTDDRLLNILTRDNLVNDVETDVVVSRIPEVFTSISKWVRSSDLKCWVCDFKFITVPWGLPVYITHKEPNEIEITMRGNMCSANCVELYILQHTVYNTSECQKLQNNLRQLYFLMTGHMTSTIKPARSKTETVEYGGNISMIEFREEINRMQIIDSRATIVPENKRHAILLSKRNAATARVPRHTNSLWKLYHESAGGSDDTESTISAEEIAEDKEDICAIEDDEDDNEVVEDDDDDLLE